MDIHPGDKGAHLMSCPYRIVSCNTCKVRVPHCNFDMHCKNACKTRVRKCQFCVKLASLLPHLCIPTHQVKGECTVHHLLAEAVSNPQRMVANIAKAEAESHATQNYTEIEPGEIEPGNMPMEDEFE